MGSFESDRPQPEWLAAYLDGELDQDARKKVEDWLDEDPTVRADLESQRRLLKQWQETAPVEPAPAAWSALLANLEKSPRQLPRPWRLWNSPGWVASILAMTAAAVWLTLSLIGIPEETGDTRDTARENAPFAVATADEIEVVSVEGADHPALAVGEMPVHGPLELLAAGELSVTSVQPDARDNMTPEIPRGTGYTDVLGSFFHEIGEPVSLSHWVVVVSLACGTCPGQVVHKGEKVKVTVVVILACQGKEHVDPQLKWIAKEVRKRDEKLTCFKLKSTKCQSLAVEEKGVFKLVDDKTVIVVVKQVADKDNRVGVAVTAPDQGEIVYRTVCGKFLPIVTRHQTKANERLILAVRVQPCNGD